jgi:hypothetical protein
MHALLLEFTKIIDIGIKGKSYRKLSSKLADWTIWANPDYLGLGPYP